MFSECTHRVSHKNKSVFSDGGGEMDLNKMLLFYSFLQIEGVSVGKERAYWLAGETLGSLADKSTNVI